MTITMDDVKKYMWHSYELASIDNDSNFDNDLKLAERAIHEQDAYVLEESMDDWVWEAKANGVFCVVEELKEDMSKDYEEDELEKFFEDNSSEIDDAIYSRDSSDVFNSMLKNTQTVFYYDLDVEIPYQYDATAYDEAEHEIRVALGLDDQESIVYHKWDKNIQELIVNAGYGGRLQIFFSGTLDDYLAYDNMDVLKSSKIVFKNPHVVIADRMNGSGMDTQFIGLTVAFDFDVENLRIDAVHPYSYSFDVCGLGKFWCDSTKVSFE